MEALRDLRIIGLLVLLFALTGCASKNMDVVPLEKANFAPEPGKAMVVFMRPALLGGGIQSSVFEIFPDKNPEFVGIVSAYTKVPYQAEPGERRFMVIGESADFMDATMEQGKTYFARVAPRAGMFKARFSLIPVTREELDGTKFAKQENSCKWVVNTPSSHQWAKDNVNSVQSKMDEDLKEWLPRKDKPTLRASDGR